MRRGENGYRRGGQFRELLAGLDECASKVIDALKDLLDRCGSDYAEHMESEPRFVYRAVGFARGSRR